MASQVTEILLKESSESRSYGDSDFLMLSVAKDCRKSKRRSLCPTIIGIIDFVVKPCQL